jgi:glutamate carboxypeptidase
MIFRKLLSTKHLLVLLLLSGVEEAPAHELSAGTLGFLKKLVDTNSGTENIDGQEKVRKLIKAEFAKHKLNVEEIAVTNAQNQERKILRLQKSGSSGEIVLLGHIDTVFSTTSTFQKLRIDGDKISGPGIIDMKGGIALINEILSNLSESELNRVQIILNDDEEVGSGASKAKLLELTKNAKSILVFEPGLPDASVVTSQSGVAWYNLVVNGKAAHAGLEPEKGFSACTELSYKIVQAAKLSDLVNGINVNPGVIEGGTKPNIVCEKASVRLDLRFKKLKQLTDLENALTKITKTIYIKTPIDFTPSASLTQVAKLSPLTEEKSAKIFSVFSSVAKALSLSAKSSHVGYGSDGNNLSTGEADILVGVGPYGGGMHTENEFMSAKSFAEREKLVTAFIKELLKGGIERKLK